MDINHITEQALALFSNSVVLVAAAGLGLWLLSLAPVKKLLVRIPFIGDKIISAAQQAAIRTIEKELAKQKLIDYQADKIVQSNNQFISNGKMDKSSAAGHGIKVLKAKMDLTTEAAERAIEASVNRNKYQKLYERTQDVLGGREEQQQ